MAVKVHRKEQENIYFYVMNKFNHFKNLYQNNEFDALLRDRDGIYWLKLRSISRKRILIDFCHFVDINYVEINPKKLFQHIYEKKISEKLLDEFIEKKYQEERIERKKEEMALTSELYRLQAFDWGGLYQNNLERTIVNNYVKKIKHFDLLAEKVDNEIQGSVRNYVFSSWFNHWTSILIEDIFNDHKKVTPTLGLIKKVDFFVNNIPFDLKVTYFPDGFMQTERKKIGLGTEIQNLKSFARERGIMYNREQRDKEILVELLTRFKESTDLETKKFWKQFVKTRKGIIDNAIKNPDNLIRWLYEAQGERRFDAANRLFLILIDESNLEESWKMKRNIDLLKKDIDQYLNKINFNNKKDLEATFNWIDGKQYSVLSDALFIVKK